MTTLDRTLWPARLSTFALAALAAASVVYWGLRWSEPISTPRANDDAFSQRPVDTGRIAQLLGASATPDNGGPAAPAVNATSQYKLLGVIAGAKGRGFGSALIAIDGEPAKPYKVGDRLSDDLLLQSVTARGATLAPGMQEPASVELELPPLATIKSR
ncbi:general secretion pathway protein C [Rhodoferax sp.]|uniref:general secretion pathway protein C n=1 Tax=Rhodoferax sp. TaxID=50421 RepID=UPI0025F014E2|nr:general secretion pathway protein C [Rhodoferax sp.]MCM2340211.1 general secretion pathway protein C [Rhodoferax sp.]